MAAPLKLAIIGGGPSAFYVASRLLSLIPQGHPNASALSIHIYDRLWAPHGLVRYGVAPDHPEVKNCTHKFDAASTDPRLKFFGNINFYSQPSSTLPSNNLTRPVRHALQLPTESLYPHYSHLLFSSGCTSPIGHPLIPPSSSCIPALDIVHWYTRHPSNPPPPPLKKASHVAIIGQGNVSLDIARMLLSSPSALSKYDVPSHVLDFLSESAVKHVSIIGRRGPLQASFTNKELREMMNLPDVSFTPLAPSTLEPPASDGVIEGASPSRQQSRLLSLLKTGSKAKPGTTSRSWDLQFFQSPTAAFESSTMNNTSAPMLDLEVTHTALDATNRAIPTSESSTIPTDLIITSLGHRSESQNLFYDPSLGHISNEKGRVCSVPATGSTSTSQIIPAARTLMENMYASGWAAIGARGVLNTTLMNAYTIADTILSDHFNSSVQTQVSTPTQTMQSRSPLPTEAVPHSLSLLNPNPPPGSEPPPSVLDGWKEGRVTTYEDWRIIESEEVERGKSMEKERERMSWEEAQSFLRR